MVIKAFIANDFIFYDEKKRVVKDLNEDSLQRACFVKITWRIQKNRQNGQSITLAAEIDQPKIALGLLSTSIRHVRLSTACLVEATSANNLKDESNSMSISTRKL